jgi:hypothetical protein
VSTKANTSGLVEIVAGKSLPEKILSFGTDGVNTAPTVVPLSRIF